MGCISFICGINLKCKNIDIFTQKNDRIFFVLVLTKKLWGVILMMYSKQDIIKQLKEIGAPKDKPVITHVSLKAIGDIEGGAQGLLEVFKAYFSKNGGALIVPTHTWSNFDKKKDLILDFNSKETCIGVFPSIALCDGTGIRTDNPTHSSIVFGDKKVVDELVGEESGSKTPTAPNGCYGKLYDKDGYVLLVGVGQEKNTYLHAVEEMLGVPNRLSEKPVEMKVKYLDGKIKVREFCYMTETVGDVSIQFPKYEIAFRKHGAITDGYIGGAKTQLCSARKMKEVVQMVRENSCGIELLSDDKPLNKDWY